MTSPDLARTIVVAADGATSEPLTKEQAADLARTLAQTSDVVVIPDASPDDARVRAITEQVFHRRKAERTAQILAYRASLKR